MTRSRPKPAARGRDGARPRDGAHPRDGARPGGPRAAPRIAGSSRWALALAAVLALTFAAYLPSLDNDFVDWDDELYVTQNPLLADPNFHDVLRTPVAGNYHPLTIWSLALNYHLSGLNPGSYHWLSLLLHLANTALVFVFVRQLSKGRFWTATGTSLFFGIHPMHVESVAWISARKDVLYALFYLVGLIAYLRYVDGRKLVWLGAALAAFVLSAASKPAAIVFPLALLAIDYLRRRPLKLPVLLEKAPFLAVALVAAVLTLAAQTRSGAVSYVWNPFQKLLFGAYGSVMYVAKLFAPVGLSAIYPYPSPRTGPGPEFYAAFAVAAVLWPAVALGLRNVRVIQFGVAFYFIHLILVLQIFTPLGGAVMADRYTYLPYVGLLVALLWWLDERPEARRAAVGVRPVLATVFALLVPVCMVLTWKRCDVWQNPLTLWNDTIRKQPGQLANAHVNRGIYYFRHAKRFDLALADFNRAISISSEPLTWSWRGDALAALGELDSAFAAYDRALELDPKWPDTWNNRGATKLRTGEAAAAVADLSRAIELKPGGRQAYVNRAIAYIELKAYGRAIADCRRAIDLAPRSPDVYIQYGTIGFAQLELGRHREAIAAFDEAIRRTPAGEPRMGAYHLYRSHSWRALGDRARALADAREAQRFGVDVSPEYLRDLGG